MESSMPHVSSAYQAGMSSSLFCGLPRRRRKRFLGNDNLLHHIDCNQSDISDESNDDELEVATVDRNSEDSSSTGSEDEVTALTTGLKNNMVAVKWFDSRPVTVISNCVGVDPITTVKRWDKKQKTHIPVECPAIVPMYNM
ncbi:uncharacterized protein LOC119385827 [Rhipicephalus sanguineus]|uniref:uncharacterized protein LOC119385827 n=1 Tax=Rhipicephalus sanguineus TaxID=34632 RepID=UPI0020C3FEEF|nr:uncharacterized protein LOC119385827 [Rhipicephalus sanguineus]